MIEQIIRATQGKGLINTAYIERLNAIFRQRLACLFRRTRINFAALSMAFLNL